MALSNSTNFSITRDQLIAGALRIAGAVQQGESPTSTQVIEASEALNMLVKSWQPDGLQLWVTKEYTLTLTASTASYTVNTPKLLRVIQAYNHNTTSNVDIPMRIITRDEYNRLGNKTSTGTPIQLLAIPNRTDTTIKVFPVPDSTAASTQQIIMVYQKPFDDFDSSTDEPEFPSEWFAALKFALAAQLAPEYGMEINERKELLAEAALYKSEAMSGTTEEGSMFFAADVRDW